MSAMTNEKFGVDLNLLVSLWTTIVGPEVFSAWAKQAGARAYG